MDEKNSHLLKPKKYENYENSEVRSITLGKLGEKQGTLGICRWRVLLGTCKFWKTHEDIQFTTSDCRLVSEIPSLLIYHTKSENVLISFA